MKAEDICFKIMIVVMALWLVALDVWLWLNVPMVGAMLSGILIGVAAAIGIILILDEERHQK